MVEPLKKSFPKLVCVERLYTGPDWLVDFLAHKPGPNTHMLSTTRVLYGARPVEDMGLGPGRSTSNTTEAFGTNQC